ncbi:MAG TPA: HesA/MoeB/ThiF family protein, partial [Propionibacteriaceae bacterium]|nr:HesA/MoeB/ThiF family protein [Propionibacteriaceae bacterium]
MRIPLAAPVVPLTEAERVRYARTMAVPAIGEVGQQRLRAASVCVVGAGGLGSPVLSYLVGAGVGRLTVIDNDHVEEHNLQRQVLHDMPHVGRPKATSATERLRLLNPDVDLHPVTERLDADSASRLLAGHDIVVDATDNLATRFALDDTCAALGIPLVWGAVQSTVGQVSVFWHAYGPGLRDLIAPDAVPLATIDTVGAFGPMVGMVGSAMAVEVVKL